MFWPPQFQCGTLYFLEMGAAFALFYVSRNSVGFARPLIGFSDAGKGIIIGSSGILNVLLHGEAWLGYFLDREFKWAFALFNVSRDSIGFAWPFTGFAPDVARKL